MDNFQQTVNLKDKFKERQTASNGFGATGKKPVPKSEAAINNSGRGAADRPTGKKPAKKRADGLDEVYNYKDENDNSNSDLRKIIRPAARQINEPYFKRALIALAVVVVLIMGYLMFFHGHGKTGPTAAATDSGPKWYSVKLVDGEIFYGQISNTSADPVVVDNVYYDYDQMNNSGQKTTDSSNLRLVKRGNETAGGNGSMDIVRTQVLYMEPLSADSKVLKAILQYEGQ